MRKKVQRLDIVSRKIFDLNELFRVVCTPNKEIVIEKDQHIFGRGAYIKKDLNSIEIAKNKNLLAKSLKCSINEEIYDELIKLL